MFTGLLLLSLSLAEPKLVSSALDVSAAPVWVDQGRRVAFIGDDGTALRWFVTDPVSDAPPAALEPQPPLESPRLAWWDPSGRSLAYVGRDGDKRMLFVHRLAGGRTEAFSVLGDLTPAVAWSPDGEKLIFSRRADPGSGQPFELFVCGGDGNGPLVRVLMPGAPQSVVWAGDGDRFAYVSLVDGLPRLFVCSIEAQQAMAISPHLQVQAGTVSWQPSGRNLTFSATADPQFGWRLYLAHARGSVPATRIGDVGYMDRRAAAWSADGKWLVWKTGPKSAPERGQLFLAPTSDVSRARFLDRESRWSDEPCFDATGGRLAYTVFEAWDPPSAVVFVASPGSRAPAARVKLGDLTSNPVFAPDGAVLAVLAGDVKQRGVWVLPSPAP